MKDPKLNKSIIDDLRKYQRCISFDDHIKANEIKEDLLAKGPYECYLKKAEDNAITTLKYLEKVKQHLKKGKDITPLKDSFSKEYNDFQENDCEFAWKNFVVKKAKPEVDRESKPHIKLKDTSLNNVQKDISEHLIGNLKPAKSWTIILDETGIFKGSTTPNKVGRFVALVIPDDSNLPTLNEYHATDERDLNIRKKVIEDVLNSNCGILGLSVDFVQTPTPSSNYWIRLALLTLDIIFRLLPIDDSGTSISIYIEQNGDWESSKNDLLKVFTENALFNLFRQAPNRNKNLKGGYVSFIGKTGHQYLGYVDAIANLWGSTDLDMQKLLENSRLKNTCLIEGDCKEFMDFIDFAFYKNTPSPEQWFNLLNIKSKRNVIDSYWEALSDAIGMNVKQNLSRWEEYKDFTNAYLESKSIELSKLKTQLSWLEKYKPANYSPSLKENMLWDVIQTITANHNGEIIPKDKQDKFINLADKLFNEDSKLVTRACLNLAVSYTNAFEFEKAEKSLIWLQNYAENYSTAAIGLNNLGRIYSSLGQHAAFMGKNKKAIDLFKKALSTFDLLSSEKEKIMEKNQTLSYLLISKMDCENTSKSDFETDLKEVGDIVEKAKEFACDDMKNPEKTASSKYMHHLLLRSFFSHVKNNEACNVYLENKDKWRIPNGDTHPWELIEMYRALLLMQIDPIKNRDEILNRLYTSQQLCENDVGSTIKLIRAVIIACYLSIEEKEELKNEYLNLLNEIKVKIPGLSESAKDALEKQLTIKNDIFAFIKAVLPFNFR